MGTVHLSLSCTATPAFSGGAAKSVSPVIGDGCTSEARDTGSPVDMLISRGDASELRVMPATRTTSKALFGHQ